MQTSVNWLTDLFDSEKVGLEKNSTERKGEQAAQRTKISFRDIALVRFAAAAAADSDKLDAVCLAGLQQRLANRLVDLVRLLSRIDGGEDALLAVKARQWGSLVVVRGETGLERFDVVVRPAFQWIAGDL